MPPDPPPDVVTRPIDVHCTVHLGTIWETARAAGVKPGTIRVWQTRGKIKPIIPAHEGAPALYHMPSAVAIAARGRRTTSRAA